MKYIVFTSLSIASIVLTYVLISLLTIMKNGVSLTADPGFVTRFKTFMTTHVAATSENHLLPELNTQHYVYSLSSDNLMSKIKFLSESLGWVQSDEKNEKKLEAHYTVQSSLFKFTDDIIVSLESINKNETQLNIRSESRVGRADFGANLSHIIRLNERLKDYRIN